jgi:signal transduction histidine kinase
MMASTNDEFTDDQLRRLLEIGRALVSELDLETLLARVLEVARDLTGARYAALGVLDDEKRELGRFVTLGIEDETRARIGPLPRGRGVLGELIRHPKPLRLADVNIHPRSFGFPPNHPPMSTFLGVPVLIHDEAWGNLYLTEKQGGAQFDEQDERLAIVLAEWASVAFQNARLYDRLERRSVELERAVRGLEASTDMARAVPAAIPFERLAELVVKRGRDLIDAKMVLLLLQDGEDLLVSASSGDGPGRLVGHRVPVDEPLMVQALGARGAYRFGRRELGSFDVDRLGIAASWLLVAPLEFRDQPRGLLAALDRMDGAEFATDDEVLFESFAASAATTLAMARTVESEKLQLSIEASEQERRRWARELHDETLQELGGLRFMLEAAGRSEDPDKVRTAAARAAEHADRAIVNLEGLITELRPASLDALGIGPAIAALVDRLSSTFEGEIDARLELSYDRGESETRLSPELEATLYRIVQEGLNNAVRHAGASLIELRVTEGDGRIEVSISDDGRGFDPGSVGRGFGLVGMRERISLASGSLQIDSKPGVGSRITAELPIERVV